MPTSSRFAVAVHVLTAIAMHKGEPVTSEKLAYSASTNPAVIRRILSMLHDAGLSRTQLGQGGGAMLARTPDAISLLDIFRAVEQEELFTFHRKQPSDICPVGSHIQPVLRVTFERAQQAMEAELAGVSIAQVVRKIEKHGRAR
ncbi:MAG: Rrf2 family transcriptional regulator [Gammaproteobacteria bacterium]|nr:Rrf2 family transcriptional regulator [Gammaproteobacteria bacterium]